MGYLRPRERLQKLSIEALSDHELLQLMIGSGNRQADVSQLARRVLKLQRSLTHPVSFDALLAIEGLGPALAARVTASFELSRRLFFSGEAKSGHDTLYVQFYDGNGALIHTEDMVVHRAPYQNILEAARRYRAGSVKISSPRLLPDTDVRSMSAHLQQHGIHAVYTVREKVGL